VIDIDTPLGKTGNLLESSEQAKHRGKLQSLVWSQVWEIKVLYQVTLLTFILFIVYPYLPSSNQIQDSHWLVSLLRSFLGTINYIVQIIPDLIGKIPGLGFLESWARKFTEFPIAFTVFSISIATLLTLSSKISGRINSEMRRIWSRLIEKQHLPEVETGTPKALLSHFLESRIYKNYISASGRILLEAVFIVMFLCLLLFLINRIAHAAL